MQPACYREADTALAPPAAGETRIIFLGDSITDYWKLPDYFPGKPNINRGIDGQTTPEMLERFCQDVLDLHPKVLVVLAGTNDIAGVTGPTRNQDIEANYASMAEPSRAHHIRMVFASVLPVHNYTHDAEESFALRPRDLADDGLHPTDAGYKIMASLAEKAIQKALAEDTAR